MSLSLKLLGGIGLQGDGGPLIGPAAQRNRLALLAVLAASHPRAVSRDKLMAWLWPGRDGESARQLLNQAVHALRQALGAEAILSAGGELQFNPVVVRCDLVAFEEAMTAGNRERAVALYAGPFLDGFFLSDAPEFERWVDRERDRLAAARAKALEGLAEAAEKTGDKSAAVEWWKARAAHDPYDSRAALRLMQALERSGNRAGALQHALDHQQLLREELEIDPAAEVLALVERLRRERVAPPAARRKEAGEEPAPVPSKGEVAREPVVVEPAAPRRRRSFLYGGLVLLAGGAIWGASRVTGRSRSAAVAPTVVDEIARAVARELDRRERGDTAGALRERRTRSIPAYELYLRGSDPALLRSDSAARRGLEYFRRAVALDSTYAAAWAGLARMIRRTASDNPAGRRQANADAEAAASKAVALDDSLAEGHMALAVARVARHDLVGAESHLRRAVALEPGAARHHERLARLYGWWGRPADALREGQRAVSLDPLSPSANAELAFALLFNGRCDEALAQIEKVGGLDPPLLRARTYAAQCYARQKRWPEAVAASELSAESGAYPGLYGYLLAQAGRRDEAGLVLKRLLDQGDQGLDVALVYAGLGNIDEALRWLDRAIDDYSLLPFSEVAPIVTGILESRRQDPRVIALRARLGLPSR